MFSQLLYRLFRLILFIIVVICSTETSEVLRPRGVPLSRVSLYVPEKDFTCLDGSISVPFLRVNDDYCDCPDGSDEPGTSACPNGSFHCTNAGHRAINIPSSRVNDGICDCCDASDEYAGGSNCINNCHELGRSAREEAQRKAELVKQGSILRAEFIKKGAVLRQEKTDKLASLEKNKLEAQELKKEKESLRRSAEEQEKAALAKYKKLGAEEAVEGEDPIQKEIRETFNTYDTNQDGKVDLSEIQAQGGVFDKDRNGAVSEDEARYFLGGNDALDLENFGSSGWPQIKPFLMLGNGVFQPPKTDAEAEREAEGEEVQEEHEDEGEYAEEHEHAEEEDEDDHEDEDVQDTDAEADTDHKTETTSHQQEYDEETQNLVEQAKAARSEYFAADKALREIERDISKLEESLKKDYGPNEEFAVLEGECFEYGDREYVYKLCPFDQASQQQKSGGSDTRLGTWSKWAGPENNLYSAMLYERGASCWNGPQRSAFVKLTCGNENSLVGVTEPNRCEYLFEFITPAVCAASGEQDDLHDEL